MGNNPPTHSEADQLVPVANPPTAAHSPNASDAFYIDTHALRKGLGAAPYASLLTELVQYLIRTHYSQLYSTHVMQADVLRDLARIQFRMCELPVAYQTAATRSALEVRSKQEALNARLGALAEKLRESIETVKQESQLVTGQWRQELREAEQQVAGRWKEREGRLALRMALFKGRLEQMKVKAVYGATTVALGLAAVYCIGRIVPSSISRPSRAQQ